MADYIVKHLLAVYVLEYHVVERNCVRQYDRCFLCSVGLSVVVTDEQGGDVNGGCLTRVTVAQATTGARK
jgi:hypothetical protein